MLSGGTHRGAESPGIKIRSCLPFLPGLKPMVRDFGPCPWVWISGREKFSRPLFPFEYRIGQIGKTGLVIQVCK